MLQSRCILRSCGMIGCDIAGADEVEFVSERIVRACVDEVQGSAEEYTPDTGVGSPGSRYGGRPTALCCIFKYRALRLPQGR